MCSIIKFTYKKFPHMIHWIRVLERLCVMSSPGQEASMLQGFDLPSLFSIHRQKFVLGMITV